jgi:hypothetical protein
MAEAIFFFGLFAAMPLLMWWMIRASRRARAAAQGREADTHVPLSRFGYDEESVGPDGLSYGTRYDGDGTMLPPDEPGAELPGIRSLQGRR